MVAIFTGDGLGLERSSAWVLGSRGQLGSASLGRGGDGVHVNGANGNLIITRQDEFLIGIGPDIGLSRTYNSQAASDGDNGDDWRESVYRKILGTNGAATVVRVDWDGSEAVYTQTSANNYICKDGPGPDDTLTWTGTQWSWTDGSTQVKDIYDSTGKLLSTKDTDLNTLTYSYDATTGVILQVTDQGGEKVKLIYGGTGGKQLLRLETWGAGTPGSRLLTRVSYTYDGSNRLSTVTVDLSPADNSVTDGNAYVTTYTYDGSSTRVASIAQTDGSLLQIAWALVGADYRVSSYTQTVAAGVTRTTSFDYSVSGRTIVTDPAGQKTILFFDASNQLTQISYPPEPAQSNLLLNAYTAPKVVQFTYNANGDVTSVAGGPGNLVTYEYDPSGNLTLERDSAGNTIKRAYDSKNELLTETRYVDPDLDGAGSGQPYTPLTIHYAYDAENHLRYMVSAEGMVTRYDYNTSGQQIAAVDYTDNIYSLTDYAASALDTWSNGLGDKSLARRTETTYDPLRGSVWIVKSYSKLLSTGLFDTSSELSQTTYTYDQAGNLLTRLTNAGTASEVFVYDGLGRLTQSTDFNGAVTRTYFLDSLGQTILTHANGLSEISTYDRAGELTSFSQSNAGGNLVDLSGWPGNPGSMPSGQASVPGWTNPVSFMDETQWAATTGPDGLQVVAMQSGQVDPTAEGGGNFTNPVTIDSTKAYEFTYYFKFSTINAHSIYFGLSTGATAYVETLTSGADNTNPYFYSRAYSTESSVFTVGKWYKAVGYVLPQGSALSSVPLGGVYDVATGQKVDSVNNFRWNPERPDNNVYARFFNYYNEAQPGFSTYFYQPEIRQVSTPAVTGPDRSTSLYRYDKLGRLRMTVDPTGRRQYMMYDSIGRKTADIDADGSATEYRYDGNDNLTSTTRYANRLSPGQISTLVDVNGNPTSASFGSLRPTADSAKDQWTWQIYDSAQRLVQTIDGTGATSVYTYDGASRVTSTTTFANRLSSTILSRLKTEASNPNLWLNQTNGALWTQANTSVAGAGTIDGANAYLFSLLTAGSTALTYGGTPAVAGDLVSFTISMKAAGTTTSQVVGIAGGVSGWGLSQDSTAKLVSGPGTLTQLGGGRWQISGLTAGTATQITVRRRMTQTESANGYAYVGYSSFPSGSQAIYAAPILSQSVAIVLPTLDAANDRVSRSFYDADGRVIATMDAAGGLSQFVYDEAGRKIRELGSAKAVLQAHRAAGTLAQMITDVGISTSDRRIDYVYDARGFLRYSLDATAKPVEYVYDAAGRVIRTVDYAGSITPTASYSRAYVLAQLGGALGTNANNRISRTVYDANGQAVFAIDATGAVAAFTYDNVGNVIKQVRYATLYTTTGDPSLATMQSWATSHAADAGNRVGRNVYDAFGRVTYTVDGEGYVVEHQYDAAGRAASDLIHAGVYTVADGVTEASLAAQIGAPPVAPVVVAYAYDADGLVSDVTDGVDAVTHYVYDAFGQVTDTIVAYGTADASTIHRTYDGAGRVASEIQGYGTANAATTAYGYDAAGNLLTVTDPRSTITTRTYDAVGRVLTIRVPVDAVSGDDLVTTNEYDALGDLVKVTDARSASSYNYYDSVGRMTLQVDRGLYVTKTVYNAFGEVTSLVRYATPLASAPAVGTPPTPTANAGDATTGFAYDKLGRLISVTDAEGKDEAYTLSTFGDRLKVRNKLGSGLVSTDPTYNSFAITYTFDRLGRTLSETMPVPAQNASGANVAASITTRFEYDSRGNLTERTEASGISGQQRVTTYDYDEAGRLKTVTHEPVQVVAADLVTVSTVTPSESYAYNLRGDLIRSIDAGGGKTTAWYDALGRKTDEVSAAGTLSHWTYDGNGNALTARVYGDAVAIPGSPGGSPPAPVIATNYRETSYVYDKADRQTSATVAALRTGSFSGSAYTTSSGNVLTSLGYDKNGNVVRQTDGNGNFTLTWYDALDRRVAQVDSENYLTSWTLDADGNVDSETRHANKIGTAVSESTTLATLLGLPGTSAANRTTNFTYDKNGRRLTEKRLAVLSASVSAAGILTEATSDATITYTYNGLGLVTSKTESTLEVTDYVYDTQGRLIRAKAAAFTDSAGASVRPTTETFYDGLGNVVRNEVNTDGGTAGNDRVTTYTYGAGGRLASTTDAVGFVRNYAYDVAGHVVKESWTRLKSDGTTNVTEATAYRYDAAGRLTTQANASWNGTAWTFGAATRIRYDTYGEVTGRGLTAGPNDTAVYQETMDYDSGGRMWRTNAGDGTIKIMLYDKAGNATLTLSSAGADLSVYASADAAAAALTAAGGTSLANAVTTIAIFDKRGQQIQSREPDRQLTSSTTATITGARSYNAFGEVASETDARINVIDLAYNVTDFAYTNMGRLRTKTSPTVAWTAENGAIANARPVETYYYDISGRMVAVRDANNKLTTRALLAGTGHDPGSGSGTGGGDPLVLKEFHADGGVFETRYDVFGAVRTTINEVGKTETYIYDKMNRLTEQDHQIRAAGSPGNPTGAAVQLIDHYSYDGLGRRITHWNSQLGSGVKETTDYDLQGRVVTMVDLGGSTATTSYAWSSTLATTGLGTFGGWTKSVLEADGKTQTEKLDYFGRTVDRVDYGGHDYNLSFDKGGRLVSQAIVGGATTSLTWFNTGLLATRTANSLTAAYGYDADGNRTRESFGSYENATVGWDALNRMTSYSDTGAAGATAPATIAYEYDLAGNIRHMAATYSSLDDQGNIVGTGYAQDYWYKYDAMNRFTTTRGTFTGSRGSGSILGGTAISYDAASRRATVTQSVARTKHLNKYVASEGPTTPWYYDDYAEPFVPDDGTGTWSSVDWAYYSSQVETYTYTDDGYLAGVSVASQDLMPTGDNGTHNPSVGALSASIARASYVGDAMGRVTSLAEYDTAGTTVYSRTAVYDVKSQLSSDVVTSKVVNAMGTTDTMVASTSYYYATAGGVYLGGALDHMVATNSKNGTTQSTVTTSNGYAWWDGARQASSAVNTDYVSGTDTNYSSTYAYDGLGHLASVSIADGRPRTVTFVDDLDGQVLQRDEADGLGTGDPRELHYLFNGVQLGDVSNDGTSDVDYVTGIARHIAVAGTGPFQSGAATGSLYADFDQSYDPINGLNHASTAASYTVQQGDSLQGIALAMWGDASLWYMIADANGLSGGESLAAGRTLSIPNKVTNVHNNADTFKVYDPNDAFGNLSATAVKPAKHGQGCGMMGTIIVAAIAIAVAVILPEIAPGIFASGALGGFGAAATAMTASAVSQGIGVATGLQNKFSWKGVALAGITAGISTGLDKLAGIRGLGFLNGGTFASDVARSMVANAAAQGVGVATGLQHSFSWSGVAAAGVVGGVMGEAGRLLPSVGMSRSSFGNQTLSSAAGLFAGAGARSLLDGTDFGDNIIAVLPDVIAMTAGNALVRGLASLGSGRTEFAQAATPAIPGSIPIQSDYPTVVVTGHRMNFLQRRLYDLETGITAGLDYMENTLRAQAESSSLVVVTRLAAAGAEYFGLHPVAQLLTHTANLESGFQVGVGRALIGMARGGVQLEFHPLTTTRNLVFAAAGGVDIAINANASDVRDAAVSGYHRVRDTFARGDSTAVGEFLGGAVVQVADILVGTHGAGRVAGVAGELSTTSRMAARVAEAPRGPIAVESAGARFGGAYSTNGELVQSIATRADNWGIRNRLGNGPVVGTVKHGYAESLLNRYQRVFGDRGLTAEARFVGGTPWREGRPLAGSIRLDVVEGALANPTRVWDYKFGDATLSQGRITQIQNGIPNGANVLILMVKP